MEDHYSCRRDWDGQIHDTEFNGEFLHGVRYTDPFRYVLIWDGHDKDQSQSVTSSVTAYHLKPANIDVPYEVTLIDGPGFNEATSRKGGFKRQRDSHHYVPQMQLHLP